MKGWTVVSYIQGLLFNSEKEWTLDTHSSVDKSQGNYAEWKKLDRKKKKKKSTYCPSPVLEIILENAG